MQRMCGDTWALGKAGVVQPTFSIILKCSAPSVSMLLTRMGHQSSQAGRCQWSHLQCKGMWGMQVVRCNVQPGWLCAEPLVDGKMKSAGLAVEALRRARDALLEVPHPPTRRPTSISNSTPCMASPLSKYLFKRLRTKGDAKGQGFKQKM